MTLLEHLREWWATRNQRRNIGPISCSIHTGPDLTELNHFTIDESDILKVEVTFGTIVAAAVEVPVGSPRAVRIMNSALDDGETAFLRLAFIGNEQWLRMQSWDMHGSGKLTAHFSRQYPSRRWSPIDGFYVENRVEPSPPVPFDEHHPHYDGSTQQEIERRQTAAKAAS